jgi:nitroreductase
MAIHAPNSSNTQTWDFHWIKNIELKKKVVEACLNQSAARTAAQFVVVTANYKKWRRSQGPLIKWAESFNAHKSVIMYYKKIVPFFYTTGPLNILSPFKIVLAFLIGLFRPIMRRPLTLRDNQEVAIKSAALAAENFVLAIVDRGGGTCMMEGFDEWRMRKILNLKCSDRVVMAIAIGYPDEKGLWGEQFRLPFEQVVQIHN